jgi:NAD(P)H-hydrate epimerase
MGAALLATKACLRSGTGLITVRVPAGTEGIVHAAVPEAMVSTDASAEALEQLPRSERPSAIGIGPGIGTADGTARLLKLLVQEAPAPLVLDADALNILAANRTWLAFLPKGSILTPHPKEFDRLAGPSGSPHERLMHARELAVRFGVVLVLKGSHTAICSPAGQVFINGTGNPGMAKGGSGDALTGIITGLCAQGLAPVQAALLGVHAHGLAGDIAAAERGMDGMTVSDLIDRLPDAWRQLRGSA